jgi:hypothetical protein
MRETEFPLPGLGRLILVELRAQFEPVVGLTERPIEIVPVKPFTP